jgi:hypothetical protein
VPGGFATVRSPQLSVQQGELTAGATSVDIDGRTVAELGAALDLEPFPLDHVHRDSTTFGPDDRLTVDAGAYAVLEDAWRVGWEALTTFVPDEELVLWPERFDVAATAGAMTFGVSPGDHFIAEPYAYVLPGTQEGLDDPFWNQPFGAASTLAELGGSAADVVAYFERGRGLLSA